ncbi:MAG: hypothetical protein OXC29_22425 [Rhodococcus sp.]|nr:hypothetical protein [Rhodococcus sp. (in: high G+C Gram-positive bacteria)]
MIDRDIAAQLTLPQGHDFEPIIVRSMTIAAGRTAHCRRCRRCGEEWRWRTYWQRWERVREGQL